VRGRVLREGQARRLDLLAAAVQQPGVVDAVVAQLPVGPGREPVVVVAVQHDLRVVVDPRLPQERLEILAAGEVAADRVRQLAGPVDRHGPGEVAGLVRAGVDVDLQEADVRVVEVVAGPVDVDQGVGQGGGGGHRSVLVATGGTETRSEARSKGRSGKVRDAGASGRVA